MFLIVNLHHIILNLYKNVTLQCNPSIVFILDCYIKWKSGYWYISVYGLAIWSLGNEPLMNPNIFVKKFLLILFQEESKINVNKTRRVIANETTLQRLNETETIRTNAILNKYCYQNKNKINKKLKSWSNYNFFIVLL